MGKAVADALAGEGAEIALAARDPEVLARAAEELKQKHGRDVVAVPTDVTDEKAVDRLVATVQERLGAVDVLIANSGGPKASSFDTTEINDWQDGIELNLLSTIYLCRAVVPSMKARKRGRIVAVTSISVKQPVDGLILSNTARAGVAGMMKTLANELAPHGVTANVVCPGYTKTDRLVELAARMSEQRGASVEDVYRGWTDEIPMGRLGEPREFADVVAFLCSSRASYVTGQCIPIDGGAVKSLI